MPFLRVLRDKRGYETTYLMHWFREGSRLRSSVLYAFRTPPAVGVGRQALEPETRRALEQQYPDVEFDWRSLRETQQIVDAVAPPRRSRAHRKGPDGVSASAPPAKAPAIEKVSTPVSEVARPQVPSVLEGDTPEEQIAFLRSWIEPVRAEVTQRIKDPARREAAESLVGLLNPEGWSGEDAVAAGLRGAADALQRLSRMLTSRRRRSRRSRSAVPSQPDQPEAEASQTDAAPPQPDGDA